MRAEKGRRKKKRNERKKECCCCYRFHSVVCSFLTTPNERTLLEFLINRFCLAMSSLYCCNALCFRPGLILYTTFSSRAAGSYFYYYVRCIQSTPLSRFMSAESRRKYFSIWRTQKQSIIRVLKWNFKKQNHKLISNIDELASTIGQEWNWKNEIEQQFFKSFFQL